MIDDKDIWRAAHKMIELSGQSRQGRCQRGSFCGMNEMRRAKEVGVKSAWAFIAATVCCLLVTSATAQPLKISPLRDLRVFNLIIEDLPPAAAKCGIAREKLDASLRSILSQSKLHLVDKTVQDKIYLSVNVLDGCASAFDLKVISPVTVVANGQTALSAAIWDTGGLRAGGDPGQDLAKQIEGGVRQLLDEWDLENQ